MEFSIRLNELPDKIQKLVFTGTIDGVGVMSEVGDLMLWCAASTAAWTHY